MDAFQPFLNRSRWRTRLPWFLLSVFSFFVVALTANLYGEDSPLISAQETSKALVDIQSVNAAVLSGKTHGFIDKSTGQILITRKIRPVGYLRSGSGVIIDPQGIIVTNAHIVRGAGSLVATFFNGTRAPVKAVELIPGTDLAFLTITPPFTLASIRMANSDAVVKNANVYTIGHSQYLKGAVIGGKIVGIQRDQGKNNPCVTALQLNFDMEKGDSGCPVIDARGGLLGIVAASFVGRGNATLAIPSNAIASAYREYRKRLLSQ